MEQPAHRAHQLRSRVFLGIFAAYYIARLPRAVKGVLDVVLTLPMVLPPTVVGYFLLLLFGAKRPLGIFFLEHFGVKLVMNWYSAIFASIVVAFSADVSHRPGCLLRAFDETLAWSAQTLGQSNTWIFWRVRMPYCRQGILQAPCWPLPVPSANTAPPA